MPKLGFWKSCTHCPTFVYVIPALKNRKKYCSRHCLDINTSTIRGNKHSSWRPENRRLMISRSKGREKSRKCWLVRNNLTGIWRAEHVVKAEKVLGRSLKKGEVVHHINGDPTDNRNNNLLICSAGFHTWLHQRMGELYMEEHFAKKF